MYSLREKVKHTVLEALPAPAEVAAGEAAEVAEAPEEAEATASDIQMTIRGHAVRNGRSECLRVL